MYSSPTVLIFSSPSSATNPSKLVKTSFSSPTSSAGAMPADIGVKLTTSAKSTDAAAKSSAIIVLPSLSRSAISSGRMLWSRWSDRRWKRSRWWAK